MSLPLTQRQHWKPANQLERWLPETFKMEEVWRANALWEGVIMKRSSLIEGGAKLRMSVPMTKGISDNIGITRDAKCMQLKIIKRYVKPQVTQTRLVLRLSVRTKIWELRSSSDHNMVLTVTANISSKAFEREAGSMHPGKGEWKKWPQKKLPIPAVQASVQK